MERTALERLLLPSPGGVPQALGPTEDNTTGAPAEREQATTTAVSSPAPAATAPSDLPGQARTTAGTSPAPAAAAPSDPHGPGGDGSNDLAGRGADGSSEPAGPGGGGDGASDLAFSRKRLKTTLLQVHSTCVVLGRLCAEAAEAAEDLRKRL